MVPGSHIALYQIFHINLKLMLVIMLGLHIPDCPIITEVAADMIHLMGGLARSNGCKDVRGYGPLVRCNVVIDNGCGISLREC